MDVMRWGIAGPGDIGARMARALNALPDAEVLAVGSRATDRAATFAAQHGIQRFYGSYAELFADPDVDIVHIASPHSAHFEMTVAALNAGKHVLCEKAFALNAQQARGMVQASRSNGRFLMEAMWMWFLPPIAQVRQRIEAGEIGEVRVVQANFARGIGETGRLRDPTLGGGALLDMGVYAVALCRLILGVPTEILAAGHLGPSGVDTNLGIILKYGSGALGVVHTGLEALGTLTAEIIGTEGTIALDPPFWASHSFTIRSHGNNPMTLFDGSTPTRIDAPHDGLAHEVDHAMQQIRAGHLESDCMPLRVSVEIMETLDEIRRQIGVVYDADRDEVHVKSTRS